MRNLIKNGLVYVNSARSFLPMDVLTEGEKIVKVSPRGELDGYDAEITDASGRLLVSGFIDVHTHGIAGYDFLFADNDALKKMSAAYLSHGVTCVMPTLASGRFEDICAAIKRINGFSSENGAFFCGVHLEGRYLSPEKRGAHAAELLSELDPYELDALFDGFSRAIHISAAFELDTDGSFIKKALGLGATLSLGHTSANYKKALDCERAGITAYTHLYNAMPSLHHRDGGPVAACLMGNSYAELICDGIHISPEVVALTQKVKGERLVLISDSMEATDCADGEYSIAGNPVTVKNKIARTFDGALAGSTLTLDTALKNLMKFSGIALEEAIISVTEAPAKEVGIFEEYGSLDVGKRADILFLDGKDLSIDRVILGGRIL